MSVPLRLALDLNGGRADHVQRRAHGQRRRDAGGVPNPGAGQRRDDLPGPGRQKGVQLNIQVAGAREEGREWTFEGRARGRCGRRRVRSPDRPVSASAARSRCTGAPTGTSVANGPAPSMTAITCWPNRIPSPNRPPTAAAGPARWSRPRTASKPRPSAPGAAAWARRLPEPLQRLRILVVRATTCATSSCRSRRSSTARTASRSRRRRRSLLRPAHGGATRRPFCSLDVTKMDVVPFARASEMMASVWSRGQAVGAGQRIDGAGRDLAAVTGGRQLRPQARSGLLQHGVASAGRAIMTAGGAGRSPFRGCRLRPAGQRRAVPASRRGEDLASVQQVGAVRKAGQVLLGHLARGRVARDPRDAPAWPAPVPPTRRGRAVVRSGSAGTIQRVRRPCRRRRPGGPGRTPRSPPRGCPGSGGVGPAGRARRDRRGGRSGRRQPAQPGQGRPLAPAPRRGRAPRPRTGWSSCRRPRPGTTNRSGPIRAPRAQAPTKRAAGRCVFWPAPASALLAVLRQRRAWRRSTPGARWPGRAPPPVRPVAGWTELLGLARALLRLRSAPRARPAGQSRLWPGRSVARSVKSGPVTRTEPARNRTSAISSAPDQRTSKTVPVTSMA